MSVLAEILARTRSELERRRGQLGESDLERRALARPAPGPGALRRALIRPGVSIIAEHKRRSPSAGPIRPGSGVAEIARAYEQGGAAAMSVLTDGPHFDGSLEDLEQARAACALPLLRKDFILDRYGLLEARLAGADAVLLIVSALSAAQLRELHEQSAALGLDALVEVHDDRELEVALDAGAEIIGVNNRDLRDFTVDVERSLRLLPGLPEGVVGVAESGIGTPEQIGRLADAGIDAALVGETLMRRPDPALALAELLIPAQAHA